VVLGGEGTLASPPSQQQPVPDRVGAGVVLGGEGTLASPPSLSNDNKEATT